MQKGTRLWIIADTVVDTRRLTRIFADSDAFTVAGSALSQGSEDLLPPTADLIIVYSDQPTVVQRVSARHPHIPLLELDSSAASGSPSTGVRAQLPDTATPTEIRAAAIALAAGLEIASSGPSEAGAESEFSLLEPLTERELEVLNLVAEGLSNPEIARQLGVSRHTVKFHVSSIMQKLGAASRTEAVTLGLKRGLVIV